MRPAFWQSVASYFSGDHHLVFDLFNEPHPDSNRDTTAAWQCVRDGGTCPGVSFPAAGMQQLVNVVRAAGATQPLMIAGPQFAGDVDQWLAYEPSDPLHQLVASVHIYEPNFAPCDTQACWTSQLDPAGHARAGGDRRAGVQGLHRQLGRAVAGQRRRPWHQLHRLGVERWQLLGRAVR